MARSNFLKKYDLKYDINLNEAEDYDLWVRISRFGKIANIPEVLFLRRVHDENKCLRE